MRRLVSALLAASLGLIAIGAILGLLGHPPLHTLARMAAGALGSPWALAETLLKSVPLLFTALAVVVAFRAGVWNIGAEGQFVVGAIAALVVARALPAGSFATAAAVAAAMLAGAAWGGIAALLRLGRNAPEVLTTILLNFVALHLLGWLAGGPLQEQARRYPQSDPVPAATLLDTAGSTRFHAGIWIAVAAAILVHALLFRTAAGLRLRAVGANPLAARWAGVEVRRHLAGAMLLSGAIAGAGGAVELLGVTHRLYERFASGAGYSGIAVALLAQLHPIGSIASAAFFGALATGAGALQRSEGIPAALATFGQGATVIVLLTLGSVRSWWPFPRPGRLARGGER
ncbi:MAG TPA: ABC transporter permease [Thermoanaerobaculia bacterium]|nr:ABC transporter permease [Thermoanaerobaculia bacterium]